MVCCNGECCTSCSVTLMLLGIRSCGQKTFWGGHIYECVSCGNCNGEDFPQLCPEPSNIPSDPSIINNSFSNTDIYKKKRDIIKIEIKKMNEYIILSEVVNSNIQYFIELDYSKYKTLDISLSALSLSQFEKEMLLKRIVSSIINMNNINLTYNIYINLKKTNIDQNEILDKQELINKTINLNLENFILNVLANTVFTEKMNNLNFDQVFDIVYAYLINYINLLKVFLIKSITKCTINLLRNDTGNNDNSCNKSSNNSCNKSSNGGCNNCVNKK
jgi:hypothetical protein